MKLILIAITLAATTAIAATESSVQSFKVTQAKFAEAHVKNAGSATLTVAGNKSVTLTVNRRFSCPEGLMCAQVMPAPVVVQLPVVSVTKDSCGIRTLTAKEDGRPVDGMLQEIVVKDASRMTCKTFVAVASTATYKTEYYSRMSGKSVLDESKMTLVPATNRFESESTEVLKEPSVLVKLVTSSGFSPEPKTSTLTVNMTGLVMNTVQNHNLGTVSHMEVAQLSQEALASLQRKVEGINPRAKLVDQNEGQPQCTDAPSSSVVAYTRGTALTLARYAGCHTFQVLDSSAMQVSELMQGLENLTR